MSRPERVLNHIERAEVEPNSLTCFVLKAGSDLMLIANFYDFFFDGYNVIRRQDITLRRVNQTDRYFTEIVVTENLHRDVDWDIEIPIDSWESIFRWLQAKEKFAMVEDDEDGLANIGPIVNVGAESVEMHWFDPEGVWGEIRSTDYSDILTVSFDSSYLTYHAKHILAKQGPPPV